MSVKMAVLRARIRLFNEKAKKEALKLALAVVITEAVMVGGFAIGVKYGLLEYLKPETKTIIINKAEAKEPETAKVSDIDRIAGMIWELESTKGKHNYSKCEAIGKINGIGYGIPGNGTYRCFESHEDEMQVLRGWIIDKQAQGMSEVELLCLYSGSNYKGCK